MMTTIKKENDNQKIDDDQKWRQPKIKTTKNEDDQKQRWPKIETTKNEDNQKWRHPKIKEMSCRPINMESIGHK